MLCQTKFGVPIYSSKPKRKPKPFKTALQKAKNSAPSLSKFPSVLQAKKEATSENSAEDKWLRNSKLQLSNSKKAKFRNR